MPEWKTAEKLKQPELTEVVGEAPAVIVAEAENFEQSESEIQHPPELPERPSFPETPPELGERYDILDFVGSGGMGSVWKVYDKTLGETFAIKVLNSDLIADATAVKRFEKEAKLASDLTHANIAAIFGPGADSAGRPYIIMKYVDGESLADIMAREGKFSEERAIDIFTQICEALQHSHMKGVIHRDIKPSNIIISKTESGGDMVHVVDFGIARCIHEEVTKTQALTKAVDVLGSPRYMSPEQLLGKEVTAQSDIYSLGCVFYEMLTGAPPFTDENPVRLILQHISEFPDLDVLPNRFRTVISEMLAKESRARSTNIDTLLVKISASLTESLIHPSSYVLQMLLVFVLLLCCNIQLLTYNYGLLEQFDTNWATLMVTWLAISCFNFGSGARSKTAQAAEFVLFLCSTVTFTIELLALSHFPRQHAGWILLFSAVSVCLLLEKPLIKTKYLESVTSLYSFVRRFFERYESNSTRLLLNSGLVLNVMCALVIAAATSQWIVSVYCCWGLNIPLEHMLPIPLSAVIIVFSAMLAMVTESTSSDKRPGYQIRRYMLFQLIAFGAFVVGTFAFMSSFGKFGYYQLTRQNLAVSSRNQDENVSRIALEALSYPDTYLCNMARQSACYSVLTYRRESKIAFTLCQQILDSKSVDSVLLSQARTLQARLFATAGQKSKASESLTEAIALLKNPRSAQLNAFEKLFSDSWIEAFTQAGWFALSISDLQQAKELLKVAEHRADVNQGRQVSAFRAEIKRAEMLLNRQRQRNEPMILVPWNGFR